MSASSRSGGVAPIMEVGHVKQNHQDRRSAKELEEMRQAGTAPPAIDSEGKTINPHIPQYVSDAPWYVDSGKVGLQHQYRKNTEEPAQKEPFNNKRQRVSKERSRKGYNANDCENCGAGGHKKKDCMEPPRKRGAKFTHDVVQFDTVALHNGGESFSTKRDKWKNYDTGNYAQVVKRFQKIEEARNQQRAEEARKKLRAKQAARQAKRAARQEKGEDASDSDSSSSDDDFDDDVDGMADGGEVIQKRGENKKSVSRNLRIREDTAKYMLNLDVNSAYYDPKSRAMREAPNPDNKSQYQGDNFTRSSGASRKQTEVERFVWDAQRKGHMHIMDAAAAPSQAAILAKQYKEKMAKLQQAKKDSLQNAYGKQSKANPDLLVSAASEQYVEYDEHGEAIKTQGKLVHKS
jgi:pre-mRNA-processing factor SLU7